MDLFTPMVALLLTCTASVCGSLANATFLKTSMETFDERQSSTVENGVKVKKTVTDNKLRLSVMVGLEGSGHHYLLMSYKRMFKTNDTISIDATDCIGMTPFWTEKSMVKSPSSYAKNLERATKAMRLLAMKGQNLSGPGHISALCHFISYPTDFGPQKVMQYLDLRLLAEVAETEGVDLRTVYMKRSAHDIVVANTVHRNFQMTLGMDPALTPADQLFIEYIRILLTDIAVVQSMLAELDPGFIVCHDYARAGDEEQATKIANFVAPNNIIAAIYEKALTNTWMAHSGQIETLPILDADKVVARLQQKLDSFEYIYCS